MYQQDRQTSSGVEAAPGRRLLQDTTDPGGGQCTDQVGWRVCLRGLNRRRLHSSGTLDWTLPIS